MIIRIAVVIAVFASTLLAQTTQPSLDDRRTEDGPARPTDPAARLEMIQLAHQHKRELLAKYPPPVVMCKKVNDGAIKIDGKLDDKAWKDIAEVSASRETRSGVEQTQKAHVKLAWDDRYLYVAVDCRDSNITATLKGRDAALWSQDAAEVFIDADGDEMSYVELEVSPAGEFYDAAIADYRPETDWASRKMDNLNIDKSLKLLEAKETKWAVQVKGTLNDSSDEDDGWTCELAVAWSDLVAAGPVSPRGLPPRDGDQMRIGLYRINYTPALPAQGTAAGKPETFELGAWNPTLTWFHCTWSFGYVIFVK